MTARDPRVAMKRFVIVTDLDGTLLERDTYSCDAALPALNAARERGVPVVFCSSKTRAEQVWYRDLLGIRDPFIVEDGGALFFEDGQFPTGVAFHGPKPGERNAIELGVPYSLIRQSVETIRAETGIELRGYGDMRLEDVAAMTGLELEAAERAMMREYQETLVSTHSREEIETITQALASRDLRLSRGGRFLAVSGEHDKATAVGVLAALYRRTSPGIRIVGIGDSHNDVSMLGAVDLPVLVQKEAGTWEELDVPGLFRVEDVGPEGWNRAVSEIVLKGAERHDSG